MSLQDEVKSSYLLKFGKYVVTASDLLKELKYRTSWSLILLALERQVVNDLFIEYSIELDDDEIYNYMDSYRERNELYTEAEIDSWLKTNCMDDDEFFDLCRYEASLEVLKNKLLPEERIVENFTYKRLELDAVELYHILVADLDLAQELLAQTKEGETFFDLAHRFSIDEETKKTCGYMGLVKRSDLRAEVEGAVFSAKSGSVLGPFKGTAGYHLYFVDRIIFAELDDETKTRMKNENFREFLDKKVTGGQLEYPGGSRV